MPFIAEFNVSGKTAHFVNGTSSLQFDAKEVVVKNNADLPVWVRLLVDPCW
jgi:hypothetical protein